MIRPRNGRLRLGVLVALSIGAFTLEVLAGSTSVPPVSEQETPAIEYTLTEVFGEESWTIHRTALSPNGRWIAFTEGDFQTRKSLWVVSTEGGQPIRLTKGPYLDDSPLWFPTSDRIAFRSTRPPAYSIMTLPVDPLTGRATGHPRQVTLDRPSAWFDVSPDGKWIAYTVFGTKGRHALRILPSNGGIARTIADPSGRVPMWSSDGRTIYYVLGRARSSEETLMRVRVEGGSPEVAFKWPGRIGILPGPNRDFVLRVSQQDREWEIATLEGHSLGRLPLPRGMAIADISKEGDQMLATQAEWVASLTILPVEGGPARQLTQGFAYDEPIGWSPDSKKVLFETALNGEALLFYAPADGGSMHEVKLPEDRLRDYQPVLSLDGKHVLYAIGEGGDELLTLKVYSIEEDWSWELSRRYVFTRGPAGQIGPQRDGQDFLFFEKREGLYELRASPPQGPSRRLKTFDDIPGIMAVQGERIAYVENTKKEAFLYWTIAGESPVRRILTLEGMLDALAWSPDGKRIAAYHYDPTRAAKHIEPGGRDLIVMEVTASGDLVGEPKAYAVPSGHWWGPRWLPDGRRILVVGNDGNLWLIPLDPGARPVDLTLDDPNSLWRYHLSPDGRTVAYPSERQRGSSIWLLKLREPLN